MKRQISKFGVLFAFMAAVLLPALAQAQVGYIDASSGFLKEQAFLSSQAVTASSASTIIDAGAYEGGVITVAVSAVSGTNPTLDVALQTCTANSAATCVNLQSITQMNTAGSQLLQANGFGRWIRVTWTLGGGTPSFTMSIYGAFKPYYWQAQTGAGDPCENAGIPKSSVPIAISSATTAALVPIVGTKAVYVCAFTAIYASGTSPTLQFKYGTQTTTACDTGAAALSGAMNVQATAGTGLIVGAGHTVFTTPAAQQLCITSGGTSPVINGSLTYVQQ